MLNNEKINKLNKLLDAEAFNFLIHKSGKDFKTFCKLISKQIDTAVDYNHLSYEMVIEVLEALFDKRLYVKIDGKLTACYDAFFNASPGYGKSLLGTIISSIWQFSTKKEFATFIVSNSVITRDNFSNRVQQIIKSSIYEKIFNTKMLNLAIKRKRNALNSTIDFLSSESHATGSRAEFVIFDDFFNPGKTKTQKHESLKDFLDMFLTRVHSNPDRRSVNLYSEQRIDFEDVTGYLMPKYIKGKIPFVHLKIPYKFTEDTEFVFYIKNKTSGEIEEKKYFFKEGTFSSKFLNQELFDTVVLHKQCQGSYEKRETLYQQNPMSQENVYIKKEYITHYETNPFIMAQQGFFDAIALACDTASKSGKHNDYSSFVCIGMKQGVYYVLDVFRKRFETPLLEEELASMYFKWCFQKKPVLLIEDMASGVGIIQSIKKSQGLLDRKTNTRYMPPLISIPVRGNKEARLLEVLPLFRTKNVLFPRTAEWIIDYELELTRFPTAKHDDQVDATVYALSYLSSMPTYSGSSVVF
jgi:predicted phage terminase large subunit-like protein